MTEKPTISAASFVRNVSKGMPQNSSNKLSFKKKKKRIVVYFCLKIFQTIAAKIPPIIGANDEQPKLT